MTVQSNELIIKKENNLPAYFNYRDIDDVDYTTSMKDQSPAPTCETYALCACLETIMQYQTKELFSIPHLLYIYLPVFLVCLFSGLFMPILMAYKMIPVRRRQALIFLLAFVSFPHELSHQLSQYHILRDSVEDPFLSQ